MPVDRTSWTPPFRKLPSWSCPTCGKGHLLIKKGGINVEETGPSRREHDNDDWDPDWVVERFCGFLICNNPECGEVASISGTSGASYYTDVDVDGQLEHSVDNDLIPLMIYPAPHMFGVNENCPSEVTRYILDAFELIWSDHESSANKFRMAIECLLTNCGIPTYSKPVKGKKRSKLTLHARINRYKTKNQDVAELLEAIKWLGNHGSHSGSSLTLENVLTAADIIEHALEIVYGNQAMLSR